jgi:hypothetical protein
MRADGDLGGFPLDEQLEGREGSPDTRVVGHPAVLERHVEVGSYEDALTRDVGVADGSRPHAFAATGADVSFSAIRSTRSVRRQL